MANTGSPRTHRWKAALEAVIHHEYISGDVADIVAGRASPATLASRAPLPDRLEVGVCGSGKRGVYARDAEGYVNSELQSRISYSNELKLWLFRAAVVGSAVSTYYNLSAEAYDLPAPKDDVLLYACPGPEPTAQWFSVLGFNPPPNITEHSSACHHPDFSALDSSSLALPPEFLAAALAALLDLRSARWRLQDFDREVPRSDTAQDVAACLLALRASLSLQAVCRSWRTVAQSFVQKWPSALRELLQLQGSHGFRVAPLRHVVKLLASTSDRMAVASLPKQPAFASAAWPVFVTSVRISSDSASLGEYQRAIALFATTLLHNVDLPWVKCLRGGMSAEDRLFKSCVACENSISQGPPTPDGSAKNEFSCDLMQSLFDLKGEQALVAQLLVCRARLYTKEGCSIEDRLPDALEQLQRSSPQPWSIARQCAGWVTRVRSPASEPCYFCQRGDPGPCERCSDKREWSYLTYQRSISFQEPRLEFAIQGRVLPFLCTSDDCLRHPKLSEEVGDVPLSDFHGSDTEEASDSEEDSAYESESGSNDNNVATSADF